MANPNTDLNNPHDKFFKATFSMISVVRAALLEFLDKDLLSKLDLSSLEIDPNSYVTDTLSEFFADIVWRCRGKNAEENYRLSFLFEHKSYKPPFPHFQLMDYMLGAWRMQVKTEKEPVVMVPIILYHGETDWVNEPLESYFAKVDPAFLQFLPRFNYCLINLRNRTDEELEQIRMVFLRKTLLAFKHFLDMQYLNTNLEVLMMVGYRDEKIEEKQSFIRTFGVYLAAILRVPREEVANRITLFNNNQNFYPMEEFDIFEVIEEIGIEKGIEKGIEINTKQTTMRCWENGIELPMIANITNLSIEQIQQIIDDHNTTPTEDSQDTNTAE
jgi:predicted transposase/invertase (TIGR01784 family)